MSYCYFCGYDGIKKRMIYCINDNNETQFCCFSCANQNKVTCKICGNMFKITKQNKMIRIKYHRLCQNCAKNNNVYDASMKILNNTNLNYNMGIYCKYCNKPECRISKRFLKPWYIKFNRIKFNYNNAKINKITHMGSYRRYFVLVNKHDWEKCPNNKCKRRNCKRPSYFKRSNYCAVHMNSKKSNEILIRSLSMYTLKDLSKLIISYK